jgi:hypothetical protein
MPWVSPLVKNIKPLHQYFTQQQLPNKIVQRAFKLNRFPVLFILANTAAAGTG